mgnify:CR=1 FL=1
MIADPASARRGGVSTRTLLLACLPAVAVGIATLAAPWFLMQPAMGSGFMASKTPSPLQNRLRSLANHTVFGVGLYLAAAALARVVA